MDEEIIRLERDKLPPGVYWARCPNEMHDLREGKTDMLLGIMPMRLSSRGRKFMATTSLAPAMHAAKAARGEGDRYRPEYKDFTPFCDPRSLAQQTVSMCFTQNCHMSAFVDDVADFITATQHIIRRPAKLRFEAQGPGFTGHDHLDTSGAALSLNLSGIPMTLRLRTPMRHGYQVLRYLPPHNVMLAWFGRSNPYGQPAVMHRHGAVEPGKPMRAFINTLESSGGTHKHPKVL